MMHMDRIEDWLWITGARLILGGLLRVWPE